MDNKKNLQLLTQVESPINLLRDNLVKMNEGIKVLFGNNQSPLLLAFNSMIVRLTKYGGVK
jgi:hypothetical protein